MKIVTGYTGTPHITSNDDQGLLQGILGTDSYILPVRSKFAYTLISSNELQIGDGEGVLQGVHFRIDPDTTESVTIENGTQGMKRIDLVCVRYEKAVDTGVESVELVVHKGTPATSSPSTPAAVTGDILGGDTEAEMALYTVELDGLSVDSVTLVASESSSLSSISANKSNTLLVRTLTAPGTAVAGGSSSDYSFNISYSGYTYLGIVGFVINAGNTCAMVHARQSNTTTAVVRILNTGTSTVTPDSVGIQCLYVKS